MEKEIILRKFKALPEGLRNKVSSPEAIERIETLEEKYGVKISLAFMAFLVGEMSVADLQSYFIEKFDKMPAIAAEISKGISTLMDDSNQAVDSVISEVNLKDKNAASDVAKMVFSSTDEQEVKSLPTFEHQVPSVDDYAAQARAIIKDFGFQDKDEVVMKRLENFVVAKLRDVRDDIETLEVLTKSRKVGGMELDEQKARFLIKLTNDKEAGFHNGQVPVAEPVAKPRIEFPVYQELKDKKTVPTAVASEPIKPLTLEEKREKDGYIVQETRNKTQDTKQIITEQVAPILPLQGGRTAATFPSKEEKKTEDLIISNQDKQKKNFGSLPSPGEVYPIIEEEDGLPVIRMPEEVMVAPVAIPQTSKVIPGLPVQPAISPKKEEAVQDANKIRGTSENHSTIKLFNTESVDQIKPEAVIVKAEPTAPKKTINLPPARPEPYISPAKTLPPKPAMMSARRPSLDDVKFVRKLIGPVEELETMTIIDFRRINPDPAAAAKKIKEKIILLEKELYSKRAEGIIAWHKSEVSRFYRLLGQASMAEGRSIEEIIAERQQAGKPTLTIGEFNAIMELNRELRY